MQKPVIVSGAQPSGKLHIGNYVGALRQWIELQNGDVPCHFFIADYHSISGEYDPAEKQRQVLDLAIDLLALGLDPKKCTMFVQSHVPEHTELAWVFNTVTPLSFLERMTQFKDKAEHQAQNVNMGLFDYPVLQAADILMYKGSLVPVGVDQVQHVELTRDIARFFNNKFGDRLEGSDLSVDEIFPETKPLLTDVPKLKSLTDPLKKMSKSHGEKSCVYLTDSPEEIHEKLKRAVTEATGILPFNEMTEGAKLFEDATVVKEWGEEKARGYSGVYNLLTMLRIFGSPEEADQVLATQPIKFGTLKELVALRIAEHFADFRARRAELAADPDRVRGILAAGADEARKVAMATMEEVRSRIGIR